MRVKLSSAQLQLIETTHIFSLGEKIELLCLIVGHKLSTEIFSSFEYFWDEKNTIFLPEPRLLEEVEATLKQLPFPYFFDTFTKIDRGEKKEKQFSWFQVSSNEATSLLFSEYANQMTEYEEGLVYGFPESAVRAFCGLVEASESQPNNPWCYYLGGVFSKEWIDKEDAYYKNVWKELAIVSPKIIEAAEKEYSLQK